MPDSLEQLKQFAEKPSRNSSRRCRPSGASRDCPRMSCWRPCPRKCERRWPSGSKIMTRPPTQRRESRDTATANNEAPADGGENPSAPPRPPMRAGSPRQRPVAPGPLSGTIPFNLTDPRPGPRTRRAPWETPCETFRLLAPLWGCGRPRGPGRRRRRLRAEGRRPRRPRRRRAHRTGAALRLLGSGPHQPLARPERHLPQPRLERRQRLGRRPRRLRHAAPTASSSSRTMFCRSIPPSSSWPTAATSRSTARRGCRSSWTG